MVLYGGTHTHKHTHTVVYVHFYKNAPFFKVLFPFTLPSFYKQYTPSPPTNHTHTHTQGVMEASSARVATLQQQLAVLAAEKPLEEVTIKEYLAANPERVAEIDHLIYKEQQWVPN